MHATINQYIIDHLHGYISAEESRKTNHLQSLTGFPRGKFGLAAGFHGFISKHQSDDEVLDAIKELLLGRIYVRSSLAERGNGEGVGSSLNGGVLPMISSEADLFMLSARQREVLSLLARGMSNKEIATALRIGEATSKCHTSAVLRALGVRNRTEAAVKATKLIDTINISARNLDTATPSSVQDKTRIRMMRLKSSN